MRLLITGAAGFIGTRLARALLATGRLGGQRIEQLVLADQVQASAELCADARVQSRVGPLLVACDTLREQSFDGVFHLASAVYGECEADDTRKGYIDGRAARLMTVTVRPGKPHGAASSFFSGIIRGPWAGMASVCPVAPDVRRPVSSPALTVHGLIRVCEASREAFGDRTALNLSGPNVCGQEMLDALAAVAGSRVRALVSFERDERIAAIVANWPSSATAQRAAKPATVRSHLSKLPSAKRAEVAHGFLR